MDYRRSLFQIEQWSPFLAKKIWSLTPFLDSPFIIALGLKIQNLTNETVEVQVPSTLQNRNEWGELHSSVLISAAQFASQIIWKRHIRPQFEEMTLTDLQSHFVSRPSKSKAHVRAKLAETEREAVLRKLKVGELVTHEMALVITDDKDQILANINCTWSFRPVRPVALQGEISS